MKTNIYIITLLIACISNSCKKENSFTNFKYSDKPSVLACENDNIKLYTEALYSFEDDIISHYKKPTNSPIMAYSQFIRLTMYNKIQFKDIVSEHTYNVFKALREDTSLWDKNSRKSHLNYNSDFIKCIAKNISDTDLKTTFNALLSTNSLSPKTFTPALERKYNLPINDRYLAAYIAFDLYYAKMMDVDFSEVDFKAIEKTTLEKTANENMKVDLNQIK